MNKLILTSIVVALISGLIGFMLGGASKDSSTSAPDVKLKAQIERAKQFFPQINDIRNISGVVTEIRGNLLVIKADPLPNPFDEAPEIRSVSLSDATIIIKQSQKDPETYMKELQAHQKKFAGASPENFTPPPSPFMEETIPLSAITTGNRVSVEAAENIKTAEQFPAIRVVLQELPQVPPPPPVL